MSTTLRASAVAMLALLALLPAGARATEWFVEVEPAGSNAFTSLGRLTFEGSARVACNVTLDGELELGYVAEAGAGEIADEGRITEARWSECTGGAIEELPGLPWTLHFTSATGSFPEALRSDLFTIEGATVKLSPFGGFLSCLYRGDVPASTELTGSNPYETGLTPLATNSLSLVSGPLCPGTIAMRGTLADTRRTKRVVALKFPYQRFLYARASDATFTFTNAIGGTITINDVVLAGGASYRIRSETCKTTPPLQLTLGRSCQVTVAFDGRARRETFLELVEGGDISVGVAKMK